MLQVDLQKIIKKRSIAAGQWLIAAATLALPLGLGKFGHVLEVDFQKKCHF